MYGSMEKVDMMEASNFMVICENCLCQNLKTNKVYKRTHFQKEFQKELLLKFLRFLAKNCMLCEINKKFGVFPPFFTSHRALHSGACLLCFFT